VELYPYLPSITELYGVYREYFTFLENSCFERERERKRERERERVGQM
jgi:N-glycosylase/DNA lyase